MSTVDLSHTPPIELQTSAGLAPNVLSFPSRRVDHARATPVLETSEDPTGAALVWPVLMLAFWALVGLGVFLVR